MRKIIMLAAGIGLAGSAFFHSAPEAQAWGCEARSPNSRGWSSGYRSRTEATRRALRECAVRTPRNRTCRITYCDPSR
jgi:hypothetical protein